jgi:deoxyribodipyrimidine photo-lyase
MDRHFCLPETVSMAELPASDLLPPEARIRVVRDAPERQDGDHVLYWMTAARRLEWNFGLDRAQARAQALGKPLVILEALRADYPWASDRLHAFALQGMAEHRRRLEASPVAYHPYVESEAGAGQGLLEAMAERACLVVTDDAPVFFLPRMLRAAAQRLHCRLEAVDSCGLLPLSRIEKPYSSAYHFRRFLQKELGEHLVQLPSGEPLEVRRGLVPGSVPADILGAWPAASEDLLEASVRSMAHLPIDHEVPPVPARGGAGVGRARLDAFLETGLDRYGEERNHPDADAASRLSPWLHWGHISPHEVFHRVASKEGWSPARLGRDATGKRAGWWGMGASAEAFLDELVTWRELGYGFCSVVSEFRSFGSLPDWAKETLRKHASDERPWCYDLESFERASTHDELWNAAQRQLLSEGVIHNYLRMRWGKKILEWSASPEEALNVMVQLNNKYAVDGRDPNSWSGIMWILGRFDRGWPERPVFGKVRSMSSDSTRRKVSLQGYVERWGPQPELELERA